VSARETRNSPVAERLRSADARFEQRNAMAVALRIGEQDRARADEVGIADLSYLYKCGLKGPNAVDCMQQRIGAVPPSNSWLQTAEGSIVARLGRNEFLVEDTGRAALCAQLEGALRQTIQGVYPVARRDAGFALIGHRANELLLEVCSFNFRQQPEDSVVMTSMAGVNVLVVCQDNGPHLCYRIWCDPTMAPYLWDTLSEIALELGGGPVGVDLVLSAKPSV